jgi:hypothetical protein
MCKRIVLFFFLTALPGLYAETAYAQLQPALNPWLQMFDRSRGNGMLDNYNRLVKPQQETYKALQQQGNQLRMQGAQQMQMQNKLKTNMLGATGPLDPNQQLIAPRETPSTMSYPASYRQYLNYYPNGLQQGGVPNYATPSNRRRY